MSCLWRKVKGGRMSTKSFNKLLKIVHKHSNDAQFTGINMRTAKITLTKDVQQLIDKYNMSVVGDYIRFR